MKKLLYPLIIALFFITSCQQQQVTNPKDYAAYLQEQPNTPLQQLDTEMDFWKNKLANAPGDIISENKIVSLLTRCFAYSGDITEIHRVDSLYF